MKANFRISWESFPPDEEAASHTSNAEQKWVPAPKIRQGNEWLGAEIMNMPDLPVREERAAAIQSESRVVSLVSAAPNEEQRRSTLSNEIRFGFAGPVDCVMSLIVPADGTQGNKHPSASFEIEFDPEQADRIIINLFDLDEDHFIHTVQQSISFPARLLAELLSRR